MAAEKVSRPSGQQGPKTRQQGPGQGSSSQADLMELINNKLIMVTGKGGTGKTTFAAALAVLGAARGKRTLLLEIDSQRPAFTPIFDEEPEDEPEEVREDLDIANLTWKVSLQKFLGGLVGSKRAVRLMLSNKLVYRFLDFTPGSQEIVLLSAVAETLKHYDLVVVDMPATGHAFSLLDITRSALGLFRSGPVRKRATELKDLLSEESTKLVFVALPEEMVVNETIETFQRMAKFELLSQPPMVFLNRATMPTLTVAERKLIADLYDSDLTSLQAEFVRAGRWEDHLEQGTEEALERLTETFGVAPIMVPPAASGGVQKDVVFRVVTHLGRMIGVGRKELSW